MLQRDWIGNYNMHSSCAVSSTVIHIKALFVLSRTSIAYQEPSSPDTRSRRLRVNNLLVVKSEALYDVNDVHISTVTPRAIIMARHPSTIIRLEVKLIMIAVTYS